MGARRGAVQRQSPGLAESAKGSYVSQLNKIAKNDPEIYRALAPGEGEHAHHKAILNTLDVLYKGLNDAEAAELTAYLNQYGATGNNIRNLVMMPGETHQGGIHPFAKQQGYEFHPRELVSKGMVRDILDASELPLEYRKHVGGKYMNEAVPAMNDKINDLLTAHYTQEGKKRFAGEDPAARAILQAIESGRDTQASGLVAGEKPTVINAGEGSRVYVEATNGNGNGNKAEKIKAILKNGNGHNSKR